MLLPDPETPPTMTTRGSAWIAPTMQFAVCILCLNGGTAPLWVVGHHLLVGCRTGKERRNDLLYRMYG